MFGADCVLRDQQVFTEAGHGAVKAELLAPVIVLRRIGENFGDKSRTGCVVGRGVGSDASDHNIRVGVRVQGFDEKPEVGGRYFAVAVA